MIHFVSNQAIVIIPVRLEKRHTSTDNDYLNGSRKRHFQGFGTH